MNQYFLKSRRILAILLVAVFALLQVNVVFASCNTADAKTSSLMAEMDDCPGCRTGTVNDSDPTYDTVSPICSDICQRNFVSSAKFSGQPAIAIATASLVIAAVPPPVLPQAQPSPLGKTSLIYRFQRLLI
jgi:hypothetical protein